jgi:hypothetical protein
MTSIQDRAGRVAVGRLLKRNHHESAPGVIVGHDPDHVEVT